MSIIPLDKSKVALIDNSDFDLIDKHKWFAVNKGTRWYAVTNINYTRVYMHQLIMNTPEGYDTDHKDCDGLNNQRSNLRICTRSQNLMNRRKQAHTTSKYKGVSWYRIGKQWQVHIMKDSKNYYLGRFDNEEEAAKRYDEEALKLFGEFARTNF